MTKDSVFDFEHSGNTLVLIPNTDLRELEFDALEGGSVDVFDQLSLATFKNVIIDFSKTDYYGSTALAFFVKFWKRVKSRGGRMVLCNVSMHEREILELTNLTSLWAIYDNRQEALKAIEAGE